VGNIHSDSSSLVMVARGRLLCLVALVQDTAKTEDALFLQYDRCTAQGGGPNSGSSCFAAPICSTVIAIASHISRRCSNATAVSGRKRNAMKVLAASTKTAGCDTSHDTNVAAVSTRPSNLLRNLADLVGIEPTTFPASRHALERSRLACINS